MFKDAQQPRLQLSKRILESNYKSMIYISSLLIFNNTQSKIASDIIQGKASD